jgi:hypothetical protein
MVKVFEQGGSAGATGLSSSRASKLRQRFKVESGRSTFILLGKDGTVKLRWPNLRLSALFDLIDAMPMRQAEMLRQRSGLSETREPWS